MAQTKTLVHGGTQRDLFRRWAREHGACADGLQRALGLSYVEWRRGSRHGGDMQWVLRMLTRYSDRAHGAAYERAHTTWLYCTHCTGWVLGVAHGEGDGTCAVCPDQIRDLLPGSLLFRLRADGTVSAHPRTGR